VPFFFRPGELVLSTACREITVVNLATKTITIASSPATWLTSDKFDIHSGSSGAQIKQWDLTPTGDPKTTTTITFNESLGSSTGRQDVEVGDWVCLAQEAALPGIPREHAPILAQATVVRVLGAIGDAELAQFEERKLNRMMERAEAFTEKRVKGKSQKVVGDQSPLWQGESRSFNYGAY
jgi:hypothetical protein